MFGSDFKYCQKRVKEIDQWLEEYEGNNEQLINKKLDEQEKCLKTMQQYREIYIKSQK